MSGKTKKTGILVCKCIGVGLICLALLYLYNISQGYRFQDGYWVSRVKEEPAPPAFILPSDAFEVKEIQITYISTVQGAIPDGALECIEIFSTEEYDEFMEAPFFWFCRKENTDKHHPDGFGVDYPPISDEQELIISYGREIKSLRYTDASKYPGAREEYQSLFDPFTPIDQLCSPYCIPLVSKEYTPNTVYFYSVEKSALASFPGHAIRPCLIYRKD